MNNREELSTLIAKLWGKEGVASLPPERIRLIQSEQLSENVIYYLNLIPVNDYWMNGIRFLCSESIAMENSELVPGCYIRPHGFLVIATLRSGDVFAVELSSEMVYLISTEKYESPGVICLGWNDTYTDFLPDIPVSVVNIKATSTLSFDSLLSFLGESLKAREVD
jgi:hypothetical protein